MERIFQDLGSSQTLKDKAYHNLRELIMTGKLQPGSRLQEEELSKQMNISRAPIREALTMLERDGFVEITPRRGAIVTELTHETIKEIWEMRLLLESYAARASASLIPTEEIDRVGALVRHVLDNPRDLELYVECDLALHTLLCKYQKNHYLKDFITTTVSHSLRARYWEEYAEDFSTVAVEEVCGEHLRIIEALKSRDPDLIFEAVEYHVRNSLRRCEASLL